MYLANQQLFQQQYFKQEKINFSDFGLEREIQEKEIKIVFSWDNQMYQSLSKTAGEGYKVSVVFNRVEAQNEKIEHFKESD